MFELLRVVVLPEAELPTDLITLWLLAPPILGVVLDEDELPPPLKLPVAGLVLEPDLMVELPDEP